MSHLLNSLLPQFRVLVIANDDFFPTEKLDPKHFKGTSMLQTKEKKNQLK